MAASSYCRRSSGLPRGSGAWHCNTPNRDSTLPFLHSSIGSGRNAAIPFDEGATGREIMLSLDVGDNLLDIEAAVRFLGEPRNTAVLGFCWVGGPAPNGAQELSLAHTFSFSGTRPGRFMDKSLGAPMLVHFGSKDEHSPPNVISAVTERFPEVEIHVYDAGHAFANDARPGFHAEAAAGLARGRTKAFVDPVLPAR